MGEKNNTQINVKIFEDSIKYIFLFFQILVFSELIHFLLMDLALIINLGLSFIFYVYIKKNINFKDVTIIFFVYCALLIIPSIVYEQQGFEIFFGFLIRIFTGYYIIKSLEDVFFKFFTKIVYFLSAISLPLFILQLIYPDYLSFADNFSESILSEERYLAGHKYIIVFLINGWATLRNSGFMWEPAAFGAVIIWAMLFDLINEKFKITKRFVVMTVAAITTFSIGTFLYIFLILLLLVYNANAKRFFYIFFLSAMVMLFFNSSPFFSDMKEMMELKVVKDRQNVEQNISKVRKDQSRTAGVFVAFKYLSDFPFGYGFVKKNKDVMYIMDSPNGLAGIAIRWGIFGLVIFLIGLLYSLKKLARLSDVNLSGLKLFIAFLIFVMPFMGNPFYHKSLIYSFIFFGYFIKIRKLKPLNV